MFDERVYEIERLILIILWFYNMKQLIFKEFWGFEKLGFVVLGFQPFRHPRGGGGFCFVDGDDDFWPVDLKHLMMLVLAQIFMWSIGFHHLVSIKVVDFGYSKVLFSRSMLNHDDVFVLDTKDKIFQLQFKGANSNIQERAKALEVIQFLKDKYHEGTCNVAIVDHGKLQAEGDSGEFWVIFGGFAPIGKKVLSDDDVIPKRTPGKLYRNEYVGDQIEEYSKSSFETDKCYLMDCGFEVFVWVGRVTQVDDRKAATQAAEPKATLITRLIQGYETHAFRSNFDSWPSSTAPSAENRGKVAEDRGKVSGVFLFVMVLLVSLLPSQKAAKVANYML
ncbi:putative villin/Gelsolin, ADF-H/Gelsolin-like domain superfamily [Helianthus annuus]|nr:putative villin/Gelsolin, ADF-H/Gelsolin-like domain superfamily [Helianthus annuus]